MAKFIDVQFNVNKALKSLLPLQMKTKMPEGTKTIYTFKILDAK